MRQTRNMVPAIMSGLIIASCATKAPLERVRISQVKSARPDTSYTLKKEIKWTDENGVEKIVARGERDSVTGEEITTVQLNEITVTARSKQVAERNGKINLDFLVTVPASLINNKWQVQLTPVAYKHADTIYLDKIFLSGADFAKMQKKGYMQYQAFINSIIPDSLYLKEMFNQKGYRKAMSELEEEYFQAWKNEVLKKEEWIDWSDKINARFAYFNFKVDRNKAAIEGYNSILEHFPAYYMKRELNKNNTPSRWRIFLDGNHKIRTKSISRQDSIEISDKFYDYKKIADNRRKEELKDEMYNKLVRFPYQPSRLDTVIKSGSNFIYFYQQELPVTEDTKKILLTLDGQLLSKDETRTQLPPSDTISYFISSMVQFLDRSPRYRKKVISRKDALSITAYVNYKTGTTEFDEVLGKNREEIDKVYEAIRSINYTGQYLIDSIYMTATSSPEGSAAMNLALSRSRAINLKKYLLNNSDDREGVDSLFRPKWKGEDWDKLRELVAGDDSLIRKADILEEFKKEDLDTREMSMRKYPSDYARIRERHYPLLRGVEFKFHLHRRGMIQDTIVMPVIDSTYMDAVRMIEERQYQKALVLLDEFYQNDYNTAICLMSLGYDQRALSIMLQQEETADRNYVIAILYARLKNETEAVKYFMKSCEMDESKIWRGKLDPEINTLIETYNLFKDEY